MNLIYNSTKRLLIGFILAVQVFSFSLPGLTQTAWADEIAAPPPAAATSSACPTVYGTQAPTGSDGYTYSYNAGACLWENAYYTWDPVTKLYAPKYSQAPVYNPITNSWDSTNWAFVPARGQYVADITSTPATIAQQIAQGDAPANLSQQSAAGPAGGASATAGTSSISGGNGTNSTNSITGNSNTNLTGNYINNVSALTTLNSDANSGNANALQNTTVGDISTGNASAVANILNMIQSSWDPAKGNLTLFSADLLNNYFGDLMFNPSIALGNGTGSLNNISDNTNQNLTINATDNANIVNDINLNAGTGDATANGNTTVGDVSTGDATTFANLINMINSMITTNQSFIGNINLRGDLNGDILLPQSLLDIFLGNGTNATNNISSTDNTDVNAASTTNSSITNSTNLTANSGGATADANTTVGNLSTGDANTNVNEKNLIGQNITGTKGLLVFVNVLGSWVGMLFGSPGTSSILGGNGTNSTNTIGSNTATNADINSEKNFNITNNLNLNAASGDATASANTDVGNVSSGNASSGANILNLIDSRLNFSDWFGVLFINVFGSWNGSFGVNTSAGNTPANARTTSSTPTPSATSASTSTGKSATPPVAPQAFSFLPSSGTNNGTTGTSSTSTSVPDAILASAHNVTKAPLAALTPQAAGSRASIIWTTGGVTIALLLFGAERYLTLRRR